MRVYITSDKGKEAFRQIYKPIHERNYGEIRTSKDGSLFIDVGERPGKDTVLLLEHEYDCEEGKDLLLVEEEVVYTYSDEGKEFLIDFFKDRYDYDISDCFRPEGEDENHRITYIDGRGWISGYRHEYITITRECYQEILDATNNWEDLTTTDDKGNEIPVCDSVNYDTKSHSYYYRNLGDFTVPVEVMLPEGLHEDKSKSRSFDESLVQKFIRQYL